MYGRPLYLLFAACYSLDIVSFFVVGIKCDAPCKKWLERGQCTTKWRRRCLRTCLALGCDDEPVRPEGERNGCKDSRQCLSLIIKRSKNTEFLQLSGKLRKKAENSFKKHLPERSFCLK